jgi:hypothetical protein
MDERDLWGFCVGDRVVIDWPDAPERWPFNGKTGTVFGGGSTAVSDDSDSRMVHVWLDEPYHYTTDQPRVLARFMFNPPHLRKIEG